MNETSSLRDLVTFKSGGTPSKSVPEYYSGKIPWITGADIDNNGYIHPRTSITREAIAGSAANQIAAGTVLLVTRTSVGKTAVAPFPLAFSQDITALQPNPDALDSQYLRHFLRASAAALAGRARGATIKGVTREDVESLRIPIPSLERQRRFATILDKADELRAKRARSTALLDDLAQSIFLDMFGDPRSNPKGWPVESLGLLGRVQGGLQVTAKRKSLSHEVPYLRVANVYRNRLDLKEIKTIKVTEHELERTRLSKADLLLVEGHGNPDEIGRAAQWDGSIPDCVHQNHLIRVRLGAEILPEYACALLNSHGGRLHLLRSANTTSGLNTISSSDVRGVPITVPPLCLQVQFVAKLASIAQVRTSQEGALRALDELFDSLQARVFSVQLWEDCAV